MAIRIYIDQGHNPTGFHNAGAFANNVREEDVTFQIGIYLADLLRDDSRFEVKLSRPQPNTVLGTNNTTSLASRVDEANSWPADYFVSIHANANNNPAINGTEVYIYQTNTQAEWLAQQVLNAVVEVVGTKDNGVRTNPSLYVLRRTNMPAILVETAYLTNPANAQLLVTDQYGFAQGIYIGILRYFGFS